MMLTLLGLAARVLVDAAVFGLVVAILICLWGGIDPRFDVFNNFQPFFFAAGIGSVLLALIARSEARVLIAGTLASIHAIMFLAPIIRLPDISAAASSGPTWKVMTFNTFWYQPNAQAIADYIASEDPDLVLLQEVGHRASDTIDASLQRLYPHRFFCTRTEFSCEGAVLSKTPWIAVRPIRAGPAIPPTLAILFALPDGRRLRVSATHLKIPDFTDRQVNEFRALGRELGDDNALHIVAGDFNATPWTWVLNRFAQTYGLRRHTGVGGTWSTSRKHLIPWFPIDHILSSPEIGLVSYKRGPKLNSDHLPVIATLRLPGR